MNNHRIQTSVKRLLVITLSIIMLFSTIVIPPEKVYAATNPYPTIHGGYPGDWSNCTWGAWQAAYDNLGIALPGWGNAGTWYDSARAAGYPVGTTPKAKSIAVWKTTVPHSYGHVAYVTAVSGNTISIIEGGYEGGKNVGTAPASGYRFPNQTYKYDDYLIGYIYLDGAPSVKPSAPGRPTVTVSGSNVTVKWNDVANETSYDVCIVNSTIYSSDNIPYKKTGLPANTTSYTFTGVKSGKHYAFVIAKSNSDSAQSPLQSMMVYDLTFNWNANGGNGTMTSTKPEFNKSYTLPKNTFTRSGYIFEGWNLRRDIDNKWFVGGVGWVSESEANQRGKQKYTDGVYFPSVEASFVRGQEDTSNLSFTWVAVWKPIKFIVKYYPNGGTGTMEDTIVTYNTPTDLRANEFTRVGYRFRGFIGENNKTGKFYYRKWNGDEVVASGWYDYEEQPEGYILRNFDGDWLAWTLAGDGEILNLYAMWEPCPHTWDGGKVTTPATETSTGVKTYTCVECKATKTETIPMIVHTHALKKTASKAATCTTAGNKAYWTCTICSKVFSDSAGTRETTKANMRTAAKGHALKKTAAKAATCTTAGNKAHWTCTSCNKVFSDSAGTRETTKAKMRVAAKGHALKKTAAKAATCTTAGNKAYWTCTSCNKVFSDSAGTKETTKAKMKFAAKGHTWDSGKVTKKATETSTGVRTYTCTVCKGTKTETIPKLTPTTKIRRLYGDTRYETSLKIADAYKKDAKITKFDSIIVACGTDFPDALSASYLAKLKNAPVVVWRARDNALVQDYIKRNVKSGGRVYLLGGTAVVDNAIKKGLSGYSFTRLQGKTRFETNTAVLKAAKYKGGEILVCDGLSFENALIASATGKPVLLVMGDTLRASQIELLSKASKPKFTIVGNTNSVSTKLANALKAYGSVTRITGKTPDEMSAKVAERYFKNPTEITLAIDSAFPDGLCGGPLSILNKGPLFLVSERNNIFAKDYCDGLKLKRVNVLGGPTLISDKLAKTICKIR